MNAFFGEYDSNATTEGLEAATLPDVIAAFKAGDSATIARAYPQVIAWLEELDGERRFASAFGLGPAQDPVVSLGGADFDPSKNAACAAGGEVSPDTERRGPKFVAYLAPGVTWADALDSVHVERVCTVHVPDTERRGPA